ncbi:hypothetical protein L1987_41648 [Smallanthus sonchifolius]|uniref:Uncharacterized protein n=1 Tax=Smallanthus sonchifolius TaxID=185202 RepID=A0ACB9GW81_9ASTR|nr:hypothetical protein L1987_41648 [Smallanthus sonchifolius]
MKVLCDIKNRLYRLVDFGVELRYLWSMKGIKKNQYRLEGTIVSGLDSGNIPVLGRDFIKNLSSSSSSSGNVASTSLEKTFFSLAREGNEGSSLGDGLGDKAFVLPPRS